MKPIILLYLIMGPSSLCLSQTIKNLKTLKSEVMSAESLKSKAFLFIQEDCQACESSLHQLAGCSLKVRSEMNLVVFGSEIWASKKVKSPEVRKVKFQSLNFMTREEAKKINVRGTPTYLIGQINELKPLSCQEIEKQQASLEKASL